MPNVTNRSRFRVLKIPVHGTWTRVHKTTSATTVTPGNAITSAEDCKDVVGYYGDENKLELHRLTTRHPYQITGKGQNSVYDYTWIACACMPSVTVGSNEHANGSLFSLASVSTEALARANPYSRPDVDALNFIWELREFPALLRSFGVHYAAKGIKGFAWSNEAHARRSDLASKPIESFFGWVPLLNDLRTLLNSAESIQKRFKKFKDVGDEFTSKRINVGRVVVGDSTEFTHSGLKHVRVRSTQCRSWAVIKHRLKTMPRHKDLDLWNEAANAAFRQDLHPATIWNAIPWSWLIDYLANVSDMLEAGSNGMASYEAKSMTVMRMRKTICNYNCLGKSSPTVTSCDDFSGVYGSYEATSKLRDIITNPSPRLTFKSVFTQNQLRNLGALSLALLFKGDLVHAR